MIINMNLSQRVLEFRIFTFDTVVYCGLGPTDGYYTDRVPGGGQETANRLPFMTIDY